MSCLIDFCALIREGLWEIVAGMEGRSNGADADKLAKYLARRDRALAMIVLAVDPSLPYLLGNPDDLEAVWRKLSGECSRRRLGLTS